MAAAPAAAEPRAVLELFTSQGCSSCPAADKLVGELRQDPSVIAMSLAVDYWDYLGWKDTLALHGHSNRQRAYANVRGDREVYTPQMVVNGRVHVLGSDKAAIEQAIQQTRKNADTLTLPVSLAVADGEVTVTAASKDKSPAGEVWLCPITRSVQVPIGRGENHGRTLTYYNVVRRWQKLGDWNGTAQSWKVPLSAIESDGADAVAVVVQAGSAPAPSTMLGAAYIDLPNATSATAPHAEAK
jgi:hypothetical protein